MVVAGSWNKTVIIYDDRTGQESASFFVGHTSGITLIKFAADPGYILVGARKSGNLIKWDLRNLQQTPVCFQRCVNTNQRIQFDISADDKYLISGDTRGFLHLWEFADETDSSTKFPVHSDCCNGVAFHPTKPIIATVSGQHHNWKTGAASDDEENESDEFVENSLNLWYFMRKSQ